MLGDSNTGNDVFDSVGFRGGRLYSSDSMYPDSLQGYAPTVRGIARTPAKVVIRQNGYVIYQSYVQPGAFAITDLNPTSSSGDLEVTVEEKDGSQQRYTVPYSTVPLLQREGRWKYDLVAGDYRSGNSEQDTPFFTQGTMIAGLADGYTLYGGTQLASRYTAIAIGAGKNLGDWGRCHLTSPMPAASLPMTAAMKGSPCGSCTQNPLTDSAPTSSCWAIATRPKASTPSTMWPGAQWKATSMATIRTMTACRTCRAITT